MSSVFHLRPHEKKYEPLHLDGSPGRSRDARAQPGFAIAARLSMLKWQFRNVADERQAASKAAIEALASDSLKSDAVVAAVDKFKVTLRKAGKKLKQHAAKAKKAPSAVAASAAPAGFAKARGRRRPSPSPSSPSSARAAKAPIAAPPQAALRRAVSSPALRAIDAAVEQASVRAADLRAHRVPRSQPGASGVLPQAFLDHPDFKHVLTAEAAFSSPKNDVPSTFLVSQIIALRPRKRTLEEIRHLTRFLMGHPEFSSVTDRAQMDLLSASVTMAHVGPRESLELKRDTLYVVLTGPVLFKAPPSKTKEVAVQQGGIVYEPPWWPLLRDGLQARCNGCSGQALPALLEECRTAVAKTRWSKLKGKMGRMAQSFGVRPGPRRTGLANVADVMLRADDPPPVEETLTVGHVTGPPLPPKGPGRSAGCLILTLTLPDIADTWERLLPFQAMRNVAFLRSIELFKAWSAIRAKVLAREMEPRFVRAGTVLYRQNDHADTLYLLATGEVELRMQLPHTTTYTSTGKQVSRTVSVLVRHDRVTPGTLFGEEALLGAQRRSRARRGAVSLLARQDEEHQRKWGVSGLIQHRSMLVNLGRMRLERRATRDREHHEEMEEVARVSAELESRTGSGDDSDEDDGAVTSSTHVRHAAAAFSQGVSAGAGAGGDVHDGAHIGDRDAPSTPRPKDVGELAAALKDLRKEQAEAAARRRAEEDAAAAAAKDADARRDSWQLARDGVTSGDAVAAAAAAAAAAAEANAAAGDDDDEDDRHDPLHLLYDTGAAALAKRAGVSTAHSVLLQRLAQLTSSTRQAVGVGGPRLYSATVSKDSELLVVRRETFHMLFHHGVISHLLNRLPDDQELHRLLDDEVYRQTTSRSAESLAVEVYADRYRKRLQTRHERAKGSPPKRPLPMKVFDPHAARAELSSTMSMVRAKWTPDVDTDGSFLASFAPPPLDIPPITSPLHPMNPGRSRSGSPSPWPGDDGQQSPSSAGGPASPQRFAFTGGSTGKSSALFSPLRATARTATSGAAAAPAGDVYRSTLPSMWTPTAGSRQQRARQGPVDLDDVAVSGGGGELPPMSPGFPALGSPSATW